MKFSEIERWNINYRSGASGDWKASKEGGEGYLLVTVNEFPYWGDAIGQIPFSVDVYTDQLEKGISKDGAIKKTIQLGQKHGDGGLVYREADFSNGYDNHMILRACLWPSKRYDVVVKSELLKWSTRTVYSPTRTNHPPNEMSVFITKAQYEKYLK